MSVESLPDQQGLYLETGLNLENFWVNWVSKNPLLGETTVDLLKIYFKAKITERNKSISFFTHF